LDHGRARGPRGGKAAPEPIDVGDDPPLFVDGEPRDIIDRRRVSVQWFSGTVLTGLCGAALMAGAVYASLDGEAYFAAGPERVGTITRTSAGTIFGNRIAAGGRKTDRLPLAGEINSARNVVRVSTTSRAGDREVVRVRPYIRVTSNLSLTTSELSANIPAFNPQRLLAEAAGGGPVSPEDGAAGAEPDPEVSFVTRDLVSVLPKVKVASLLPVEDVVAQVRDAATWAGGAADRPTRRRAQGRPEAAHSAFRRRRGSAHAAGARDGDG
jgi:hypothetical protein